MADISVYSRAHRAFRLTPRFHFARNEPDLVDRYLTSKKAGVGLCNVVGVYLNPYQVQPEVIIVDEIGLVISGSNSLERVYFSEIESIDSQNVSRDGIDIYIALRSGIVIDLCVAGRDGQFRDVLSFIQFLSRVLEDIKERHIR